MPSSADEAIAQEGTLPNRKDSPRQAPVSKKQKKKAKKAGAAVKAVEETNSVSTSPPFDLL